MFTETLASASYTLTSLSLDALIVIGLSAIFFLIALKWGRIALANFILGSYVALVFLLFFPFENILTFNLGLLFGKFDITHTVLFLLFAILISVFFSRILDFYFHRARIRKTFETLVLSIGSTLMVLSGAFVARGVETQSQASSFLDVAFSVEVYVFGILVFPLLSIFFISRD